MQLKSQYKCLKKLMKFDSKRKKTAKFLAFFRYLFPGKHAEKPFASWLGVGEGKLGVLDYL